MNRNLILAFIFLTCIPAGTEESQQFSSAAAKRARASYEKQAHDALIRYYRDLQAAQKIAMDVRDLNEANLIQRELDSLKSRLVKSAIGDNHDVTVNAVDVAISPRATGIKMRKGQHFVLEPNAEDKWTGGGSKSGVFCDYMGYDDQGNTWMRLMWRIGNGKAESVVSGKILVAEGDGELLLFVKDDKPAGNKGKIRVNIFVSPE